MKFCNEVAGILHLLSVHTSSVYSDDYNNQNYGAGIECAGETFAGAIGSYRNSFRKTTMYGVGGAFVPTPFARVRIGGFAGLASGYDAPFIAGIQARLRITEDFSAGITVAPQTTRSDGFVHLTFRYTLWRD